jgi:hypothetical protein
MQYKPACIGLCRAAPQCAEIESLKTELAAQRADLVQVEKYLRRGVHDGWFSLRDLRFVIANAFAIVSCAIAGKAEGAAKKITPPNDAFCGLPFDPDKHNRYAPEGDADAQV